MYRMGHSGLGKKLKIVEKSGEEIERIGPKESEKA